MKTMGVLLVQGERARFRAKLEAAHLGEADVEEDEVEGLVCEGGEAAAGVFGSHGFEAGEAHGGDHDFAGAVFVIDDEDAGGRRCPLAGCAGAPEG